MGGGGVFLVARLHIPSILALRERRARLFLPVVAMMPVQAAGLVLETTAVGALFARGALIGCVV